jgi:hypothetical protein
VPFGPPRASVDWLNESFATDEVAGADVICAVIVSVPTFAVVSACVNVIVVAPEATNTRAGAGVPAAIAVMFAFAAADAGATDVRTPKPKAATVTSATRLKVVFVDICFLSISRSREFPSLGLELKFLTPVR